MGFEWLTLSASVSANPLFILHIYLKSLSTVAVEGFQYLPRALGGFLLFKSTLETMGRNFGFERRWEICPHALPQFLSIHFF